MFTWGPQQVGEVGPAAENIVFRQASNRDLYYSLDNGETWSFSTPDFGAIGRIGKFGAVFVMVIDANTSNIIRTSTNGIVWTPRTSTGVTLLVDIAWNGSVMCAIGRNATANSVLTSTDGITWSRPTVPAISGGQFNSIVWTGTKFAAVANVNSPSQNAIESADGVTWATASYPTSGGAPQDQMFLCGSGLVRFSGALSTAYYESSDQGASWTLRNLPSFTGASTPRGLASSPSVGVLAGSNGIFRSVDNGVSFTKVVLTDDYLAGQYNGQYFFAARQNGSASLRSEDGLTWSSIPNFPQPSVGVFPMNKRR